MSSPEELIILENFTNILEQLDIEYHWMINIFCGSIFVKGCYGK